jgi:hypothetical protein
MLEIGRAETDQRQNASPTASTSLLLQAVKFVDEVIAICRAISR